MATPRLTVVADQVPKKNLSQHPNAIRSRKRREADPEKFSRGRREIYGKVRLERPKDVWLRYTLHSAKKRAEKKGVSFSIGPEDITIPDFCPYLGLRLEISTGGKAMPNSPSLDRIHPELGYVAGNVQVISYRANTIKSFGTAEEHERIAFVMRQQGLR